MPSFTLRCPAPRRRRAPARVVASLAVPLIGLLAGCGALRSPAASDPPGSAEAARCAARGPDIACTEHGAVRGVMEGTLLSFKGIPYAQPPVGRLRWQPPQPPHPWSGVRDATRFGAICPQLVNGQVAGEEDCLTLNVWTAPRLAGGDTAPGPRAVMVFFPGGGNHGFSGQGAPVFGGVAYSGGALVPQDVVLVTFNWRLGALGYLAHPALDAERRERVSGNWGLLDQVAALRWVRRNIAAFGGDPKRVFAFGTSAGGGNLCTLLATPAAHGLLTGVALQASVPTGCELPTLAEAQAATGQRVAQALGCASGVSGTSDTAGSAGTSSSAAHVAACLRARPMSEVVRAVPGTFGLLPRLYGPVVDGVVVPQQPIAAIHAGRHTAVHALVGNSTHETMQFVDSVGPVADEAAYATAVARVFGAQDAPRIVTAYPAASFASPREALVRLTTDAYFTCSSRRVARALARNQAQPVFRFLFDHALENDPAQRALGAVHTLEHFFLFPFSGRYVPTEAERGLQRLMAGHWTLAARTGRPGSTWPATVPGDAVLRIGPGASAEVVRPDAAAQCDFWDTVRLPQPHL